MIHQPLGGAQGGQTDIDIQVIVSFFIGMSHLCSNQAVYVEILCKDSTE